MSERLSEADIKELLEDHQRIERRLREDERARVIARLGFGETETASGPVQRSPELVLVEDDDDEATTIYPVWGDDVRVRRAKRRLVLQAGAALIALVAVVSVVRLVGDGESPSVVVADQPLNAPPASPATNPEPPTCPAAVMEFVEAVDAWDGIERWAELVDERRPDPDLPTLAAAALAEWRGLAPDDELHQEVDVAVEEPEFDANQLPSEIRLLRAEPLNLVFDRLWLASQDEGGPIAPCAETITVVADELSLPPSRLTN